MHDKLIEECGIFVLFDNDNAAVLTQLGLYVLQQSGQECSGILSFVDKEFIRESRQGVVEDNFNDKNVIKNES